MNPKLPPTPDWQIGLIGLDEEHWLASIIAVLINSGRAEEAGKIITILQSKTPPELADVLVGYSPRLLRLVTDACEGKRWKQGVTATYPLVADAV